MILVGPGTGIAPFRGFWQELEYRKDSGRKSEVFLYTGCRNPQEDFLFQDEIHKCHSRGVLSKVYCAFSRLNGKPKVNKAHVIIIYPCICKVFKFQNPFRFDCQSVKESYYFYNLKNHHFFSMKRSDQMVMV